MEQKELFPETRLEKEMELGSLITQIGKTQQLVYSLEQKIKDYAETLGIKEKKTELKLLNKRHYTLSQELDLDNI